MKKQAQHLVAILALLVFSLFISSSPLYAQEINKSPDIIQNEIIVKYKYGTSSLKINNLQKESGLDIIDELPRYGHKLLKVPQGQSADEHVEALKNNPLVESVSFNNIYKAAYTPNDPYLEWQWGLYSIKAPNAWDIVKAGQVTVKVAVLDTGINASHPDLQGKVGIGKNFIDPYNPTNTHDGDGHGTHVAGIIGATMNNSMGVTGVASGVTLLPVKVLDDLGNGTDWSIAKGIDYAVASGAKVINMSLGGPEGTDILATAVENAAQKGIIVVAATGNENTSVSYPAAYSSVIGIAAVDYHDQRAWFSNYGSQVELSAPGVQILSTFSGPYADPADPYYVLDGTSMATPYVAGLAALMLSENPMLTSSQVRDILRLTATDLGAAGKDDYFGYGKINAYKAVNFGKIQLNLLQSDIAVSKPVGVEVNVVDINGTVKTSVNGFVEVNVDDSLGNSITIPLEVNNGTGIAAITFDSAGSFSITANDGSALEKWVSSESLQVSVSESTSEGIMLSFPANATVGESVYGTVYATDNLGNIISDFEGQVRLTSDHISVILPEEPVNYGEPFLVIFEEEGFFSIDALDINNTSLRTTSFVEVKPPVTLGIKGKVLLESRNTHGGILVEVAGTNYTTYTGSDGSFNIESLPVGTFSLLISHDRYLTKIIGQVAAYKDQITLLSETQIKAGDINSNNEVDIFDLVILARAYRTSNTDSLWNSEADINNDEQVDINDLFWLAKNYGEVGDRI